MFAILTLWFFEYFFRSIDTFLPPFSKNIPLLGITFTLFLFPFLSFFLPQLLARSFYNKKKMHQTVLKCTEKFDLIVGKHLIERIFNRLVRTILNDSLFFPFKFSLLQLHEMLWFTPSPRVYVSRYLCVLVMHSIRTILSKYKGFHDSFNTNTPSFSGHLLLLKESSNNWNGSSRIMVICRFARSRNIRKMNFYSIHSWITFN